MKRRLAKIPFVACEKSFLAGGRRQATCCAGPKGRADPAWRANSIATSRRFKSRVRIKQVMERVLVKIFGNAHFISPRQSCDGIPISSRARLDGVVRLDIYLRAGSRCVERGEIREAGKRKHRAAGPADLRASKPAYSTTHRHDAGENPTVGGTLVEPVSLTIFGKTRSAHHAEGVKLTLAGVVRSTARRWISILPAGL